MKLEMMISTEQRKKSTDRRRKLKCQCDGGGHKRGHEHEHMKTNRMPPVDAASALALPGGQVECKVQQLPAVAWSQEHANQGGVQRRQGGISALTDERVSRQEAAQRPNGDLKHVAGRRTSRRTRGNGVGRV